MSPAPGAERLKVVLDTNLYIAAFEFPRGRNASLWRAACHGRYRLITSPAIIREVAGVLRADFKWPDDRVQHAIRRIADVADRGIVTPRRMLRVVAADPDDNRILECAVEGEADIVVSNDHHLLDLGVWSHIPIVTGAEFRRTLGMR